MNHSFLDIEDSAATVQYYKKAYNGASMSAADSMELVNKISKEIARVRANGFMSFVLNKNKTFSWKGSMKDPNDQFSGTYSCNGETITLNAKKGNDSHQILLQIISLNKNRITIQFPSEVNSVSVQETTPSGTKNKTMSDVNSATRMSFKRVP